MTTRKYTLVIEGDPGGYSAYVPELPAVLVTGRSVEEITARGADLNRLFHLDDHPVINAIKRVVAQRQFALALMLHEDYDAEGYYVYEVKRELPFWGEGLLKTVARFIPIDSRAKIDGRSANVGLIRRRFQKSLFLKMGYPEAIWLHEFHASRSLTVESPSEFALEQRVRAHGAVIEECVRLALR